MEGENFLVDWGIKTVKGDKNARSLSNVANLIGRYSPEAVAIEDCRVAGSRRALRIRELLQEIIALSEREGMQVVLCTPKEIRLGYFKDGKGTKHAVAQLIARRFPEELGSRLPRKRRLWMSEDCRMDIFHAVALAESFFRRFRPAGTRNVSQ